MKSATITEAKNGLSALIDRVRAGESVLILDRGVPVARIEPIAASGDATGRVRRLQRAGIIRAGLAAPPLHLLKTPSARVARGGSALDELLEERRSGR